MTIKRDWKGHIKRNKVNRDFRRAHAEGAFRQILEGKREEASFGVRMRGLLSRFFGAV